MPCYIPPADIARLAALRMAMATLAVRAPTITASVTTIARAPTDMSLLVRRTGGTITVAPALGSIDVAARLGIVRMVDAITPTGAVRTEHVPPITYCMTELAIPVAPPASRKYELTIAPLEPAIAHVRG